MPNTCEDATDLVQEYLNYRMFRGHGPCGLDNDRRVLSAFWTWLYRGRLVSYSENPCARRLLQLPPDMNIRSLPLTK
ncbi:MAG: hypothetical protein A2W31_05165 [Planctomycetes bacterium RBG_16_64_10]|nr:MAG: hypothetical protein A2W31_05165 [Planctomycetes bacterium RBG_16_64_10]